MSTVEYGPLMIDIAGTGMTAEERSRLMHPLVGGVILFTRNYADPQQLTALCAEIHALRDPPLLIAIDHEGGRVQRCREGFTRVPPMQSLGAWWEHDASAALAGSRAIGFTLAAELRACGVDLSFTPVLDLDYGASGIIGDRAFHRQPQAVIELAGALIDGLHDAGMACCGKHFPGHGFIRADSHLALPVDGRSMAEMTEDQQPYRELIEQQRLDAVMAAHVLFPQADARPAGFSPVWLGKLRSEFNFGGAIFSDDLSMEGASIAGDMVGRVEAGWQAGCDMMPVCNVPDQVGQVLERWSPVLDAERSDRIARLMPVQPAPSSGELARLCAAGREACQRLIT